MKTKVWLIVRDSQFPYMAHYEALDTGKDYKICAGLHIAYNAEMLLARLTEAQYNFFVQQIRKLNEAYQETLTHYKKEAQALRESLPKLSPLTL